MHPVPDHHGEAWVLQQMVALLSGTPLSWGSSPGTGLGVYDLSLFCLALFALKLLSSRFWIPETQPLLAHCPIIGLARALSLLLGRLPPFTCLYGRALRIRSNTPALLALPSWPSVGSLEAPLDLLLVVSPPVS